MTALRIIGLIAAVYYLCWLLSSCADNGDHRRVVHPVTWHELGAPALAEMCRDWDPKLRGCIVVRPEGDHVYTLPVLRAQ